MTYDRLSRQDTVLLEMESPNVHMQTGAVIILEGGVVTFEESIARMGQRLHLVPRARERVARVPFRLHRPVWVDDTRFDIRHHMNAVMLPPPGTEDQLFDLAARFLGEKLDLTRAPWQILLVGGLEGGRAAVIRKQHHIVADGVSAANNAAALLDLTPDAPEIEPPPWTPRPAPTRGELVRDALRARKDEWARFTSAMAANPGEKLQNLKNFITGGREVVQAMTVQGAHTPTNVEPGAQRRLRYVRSSLDDFKEIRAKLGGTVNDVVLTAVTSALVNWFDTRGYSTGGKPLRVAFPKTLRPNPGPGVMSGNEVSSLFAELPAMERDPVRLLKDVTAATTDAKESMQAIGFELMSKYMPPRALAEASRRFGRKNAPVNVTVTNIPGPPIPLYLAGRRILDLVPMTPLAGPVSLMIGVVSYCGQLSFGLTADFDAIPDLDVLAGELARAIDTLRKAAGIGEDARVEMRETAPSAGA